jgi:hypothetical protein
MVAKFTERPDAASMIRGAISFGTFAQTGERLFDRHPQDEPITLERLLRREGLLAMRHCGNLQQKRKWRAALFIFSRVPLLAGPALALYRHDNDNAKVN